MTHNKEDLERRIVSSVRRIGRRVVIDGNAFDAALSGTDPDPTARPVYLTIRQVVDRHPAFTEPALRQLIAKAEARMGGEAA
jgi:hypothetical protein